MKKLKHIDPITFDEKELSFEDFHYEITEKLRKSLPKEKGLTITNVMTDNEGSKLIFGLMKRGEHIQKLRISVEVIGD